jgi:hypothetical protein
MRPQPSADDRWVTGDHFRLPIPADPAALRAGGAAFLTEAFRVSGALTAGNAVTRISRYQEVPGGSNVDNAWFWRDADNVLHCGLLDWGCVGQMNVAMALWGAMSGAETDMWERHLDDLLRLFVAEIRACGGPDLEADELHNQLMLYVGIMAVAWLLDVPALIRSRFGDAARSLSRNDPLIKEDESVRAPLQMLTNALSLWETRHFGDLLNALG